MGEETALVLEDYPQARDGICPSTSPPAMPLWTLFRPGVGVGLLQMMEKSQQAEAGKEQWRGRGISKATTLGRLIHVEYKE